MTVKVVIRQGTIVGPSTGGSGVRDLFIQNGRIDLSGNLQSYADAKVINAKGRLVLSGLVDLATHLREPGLEHKATIASELRAAIACGITTLCCLPATSPPITSPSDVQLVQQRARQQKFDNVLVIGGITADLKGEALAEMAALKSSGCVAVSNVLNPWADTGVLKRALEYAMGLDLLVMLYPMDCALSKNGCAHQGRVSAQLGLSAIPVSAETSALAQYLALIEDVGTRVHFCRLSCARSVEMIAQAHKAGLPVTADVAAHQLFLCDEDVRGFDSGYHVLPPLRSREDRDALRWGLSQDVISAVCSDHQPHDANAKLAPFPSSEPGISSLETLLPLMFELVDESVISLTKAVALVTTNPAQILGIDRGRLDEMAIADICIVDPSQQWTLTKEAMLSAGKNTPFLGKQFSHRVTHTIINGVIAYGE